MTDARRRRPSTVAPGGAWVLVGVLIPQAYLLVLSVVIARHLGPVDFGRQSLIAFAVVAATTLASAGTSLATLRSVAACAPTDPAIRAHARWAASAMAASGVVGGMVVTVPGLLGARPQGAWLLGGLTVLLGSVQAAPAAVLSGLQRWRDATVVGLVTGLVGAVAMLVVVESGGGITGLFAVEAAVALANLVGTGALCHRVLAVVPGDPSSRGARAPQWRFAALTTGGAALTLLIWRRSELVALGVLADSDEVGRYSIAFGPTALLLLLAERAGTSLVAPFSARQSAGGSAALSGPRLRATRVLLLLVLPGLAVAAGVAPAAIRVVFGDAYADSGVVAVVLLFAAVALPWWTVSTAALWAVGDARSPLLAGAVAAVVDVAACLVLVPDHGALGAAVASGLAQVTATVMASRAADRSAGGPTRAGSAVGRVAVVAGTGGTVGALMTAAVDGVVGVGLALAVAGGAVLLSARIVRPLAAEDVAWWAERRRAPLSGPVQALVRWTSTGSPAGVSRTGPPPPG